MGAVDYIKKPFDDTIVKLRVKLQVQNVSQLRLNEQLREEIEQLKKA
jgi:PleD family two-component response regulator